MPLALRDHPHSAIEPFLWGTFADNPQILDAWGKRFQVSPRSSASSATSAKTAREPSNFSTRSTGIDSQQISHACYQRADDTTTEPGSPRVPSNLPNRSGRHWRISADSATSMIEDPIHFLSRKEQATFVSANRREPYTKKVRDSPRTIVVFIPTTDAQVITASTGWTLAGVKFVS